MGVIFVGSSLGDDDGGSGVMLDSWDRRVVMRLFVFVFVFVSMLICMC